VIVVVEGHGELHLKTFLKDLEKDLEHLSRGYLGLEILLERPGAIVVEGHGELQLETYLSQEYGDTNQQVGAFCLLQVPLVTFHPWSAPSQPSASPE
jgi:hypothetical protein